MKKPSQTSSNNQGQKFKEAARDLGCDEDEARFAGRLKEIGGYKPPPDVGAVKRPRKPANKKPGE